MKIDIEKITISGNRILHDVHLEIGKGITLIVGDSGSGKSTLLRELVPGISRVGKCEGTIQFMGQDILSLQPGKIGFISQHPDNQIVCDKVWHELAFGLESMGVPGGVIRNRVAEICTCLGIEGWFMKRVTELSEGEKQKLVLASVLCMAPQVIVMDEPTSMLDPIAARNFWELVIRFHEEHGIRFIIAAHDTEYIYDYADAIYTLQQGTVVAEEHYNSLPEREKIRRHGRGYTEEEVTACEIVPARRETKLLKTLRDIRGSYEGQTVLAVRHLEIHQGINAWIGPNGAGKSTLGKVLAGYFGKKVLPNLVMMPQDVLTIFTKETVRQELDMEADIPLEIEELCASLMERNPLDLSGGEQHLVAVCKFLLKNADYLILDEPTKGVDYQLKRSIERLLQKYARQQTIILITHDLELVGEIAEYVVFLFYGDVASMGEPHHVFEQNVFYKPYITRWNPALLSKEELE